MPRYFIDNTDDVTVVVVSVDDDVTYTTLSAETYTDENGIVKPKYEETGLGDSRVTPTAKYAPTTPAAAYTKTYSTSARTVPNATVAAVATTGSTTSTPYGFSTSAQADAIPVAINALSADVLALKKLVVAIIDDLEAVGISG